MLVGGAAWRQNPPGVEGALKVLSAQTVIGAICDATRALASAGLLDNVDHVSNDADTIDLPGYHGAARFRPGPKALRDGRIVTAAGTAPVSFMAEMLAALALADDNTAYYQSLLAREHVV